MDGQLRHYTYANRNHNMIIFSKRASFSCLSVCLILDHSKCTSVNWRAAPVFHMQDVAGLNPKPGTERAEWGICHFPQPLYVNSVTLPRIIPQAYLSTSCPIHHSVVTASFATVQPETLTAAKHKTNINTPNNWIWGAEGCKASFMFEITYNDS